jgi:hypothetical protein
MSVVFKIKESTVVHRDPPRNLNFLRKISLLYRPGLASVGLGGGVIERFVAGSSDTDFEWLDYESPNNLVLEITAADEITATWSLHSGSLETGVQYEIDTVNTFDSIDLQTFNLARDTLENIVSGLIALTQYYVRVRVVRNGVYSEWSSIETATLP